MQTKEVLQICGVSAQTIGERVAPVRTFWTRGGGKFFAIYGRPLMILFRTLMLRSILIGGLCFAGTRCHIIGFGHLFEQGQSPYLLHEAITPLLSQQQCSLGFYADRITRRMICAGYPSAGGVGICHVRIVWHDFFRVHKVQ